MVAPRTVPLVVALVVAALVLAPGATAAFVGEVTADVDVGGADGENESAPSMGTKVSTFMQSTAADADASVDDGMFDAAFENGDEERRAAVVEDRTRRLEERFASLEAEREDLREREGELNPAAYDAKLASLAVRLDALERAINETEPRAKAVGADTNGLEELRANASALSGPDVAEVAAGLHGVDPPRGPPEGVPGRGTGNEAPGHAQGNGSESPGNGPGGPDAASGSAPGLDRGNAGDEGTNRGPNASVRGSAPDRPDENRSPNAGAWQDDRSNGVPSANRGDGTEAARERDRSASTEGPDDGDESARGDSTGADERSTGNGDGAPGNDRAGGPDDAGQRA